MLWIVYRVCGGRIWKIFFYILHTVFLNLEVIVLIPPNEYNVDWIWCVCSSSLVKCLLPTPWHDYTEIRLVALHECNTLCKPDTFWFNTKWIIGMAFPDCQQSAIKKTFTSAGNRTHLTLDSQDMHIGQIQLQHLSCGLGLWIFISTCHG